MNGDKNYKKKDRNTEQVAITQEKQKRRENKSHRSFDTKNSQLAPKKVPSTS